jgi:uncharacterized protein YcaQ
VGQNGRLSSHDARTQLGRERVTNAWGGISAASTRALEALHHRGLLRVAYRHNGTKVYEERRIEPQELSPDERLTHVTLLLARLLAPVPEPSLRQALSQVRMHCQGVPDRPALIGELRRSGELASRVAGGLTYLWPANLNEATELEEQGRVRFLAPFDPVVWDRRRFEHLWGWPYRFEAYTPIAKRRFGYYALPLFWRDEAIGWVNCLPDGRGAFQVVPGFIEREPREPEFRSAFEEEVERLHVLAGRDAAMRDLN